MVASSSEEADTSASCTSASATKAPTWCMVSRMFASGTDWTLTMNQSRSPWGEASTKPYLAASCVETWWRRHSIRPTSRTSWWRCKVVCDGRSTMPADMQLCANGRSASGKQPSTFSTVVVRLPCLRSPRATRRQRKAKAASNCLPRGRACTVAKVTTPFMQASKCLACVCKFMCSASSSPRAAAPAGQKTTDRAL